MALLCSQSCMQTILLYCLHQVQWLKMAASKEVWPTYGELINMLKISEKKAETMCNSGVAELLTAEFHHKFPQTSISRPSRSLDTVRRLEAPTRPSALGQRKLDGSPLKSYLKRKWIPRIWNTHLQQGMRTTAITCLVRHDN